jgi:hypothetical protein
MLSGSPSLRWFVSLGIQCQRALPDNAKCYAESKTFRGLCAERGICQSLTRPYTPRTNEKGRTLHPDPQVPLGLSRCLSNFSDPSCLSQQSVIGQGRRVGWALENEAEELAFASAEMEAVDELVKVPAEVLRAHPVEHPAEPGLEIDADHVTPRQSLCETAAIGALHSSIVANSLRPEAEVSLEAARGDGGAARIDPCSDAGAQMLNGDVVE